MDLVRSDVKRDIKIIRYGHHKIFHNAGFIFVFRCNQKMVRKKLVAQFCEMKIGAKILQLILLGQKKTSCVGQEIYEVTEREVHGWFKL